MHVHRSKVNLPTLIPASFQYINFLNIKINPCSKADRLSVFLGFRKKNRNLYLSDHGVVFLSVKTFYLPVKTANKGIKIRTQNKIMSLYVL